MTKYLVFDNFVPFSSAIVRGKCFDILGKFDESLAMGIDWDLWLRISSKYHLIFVMFRFCFIEWGIAGRCPKMLKNVSVVQTEL